MKKFLSGRDDKNPYQKRKPITGGTLINKGGSKNRKNYSVSDKIENSSIDFNINMGNHETTEGKPKGYRSLDEKKNMVAVGYRRGGDVSRGASFVSGLGAGLGMDSGYADAAMRANKSAGKWGQGVGTGVQTASALYGIAESTLKGKGKEGVTEGDGFDFSDPNKLRSQIQTPIQSPMIPQQEFKNLPEDVMYLQRKGGDLKTYAYGGGIGDDKNIVGTRRNNPSKRNPYQKNTPVNNGTMINKGYKSRIKKPSEKTLNNETIPPPQMNAKFRTTEYMNGGKLKKLQSGGRFNPYVGASTMTPRDKSLDYVRTPENAFDNTQFFKDLEMNRARTKMVGGVQNSPPFLQGYKKGGKLKGYQKGTNSMSTEFNADAGIEKDVRKAELENWQTLNPSSGNDDYRKNVWGIAPSGEEEPLTNKEKLKVFANKTLASLGQSKTAVIEKAKDLGGKAKDLGKKGVEAVGKADINAGDTIGEYGRFLDVQAGRTAINRMEGLETPRAKNQKGISLAGVDYSAARSNVDKDVRASNKSIELGNSATKAGVKASSFGTGLEAKAGLWDREHQANSNIKNQEAQLNVGITARNIANQYQGDTTKFQKDADLIAMRQENTKTLAGDFEALGRDINLKKDNQRANLLEAASSDPRSIELMSQKMDDKTFRKTYGVDKTTYFNISPEKRKENIKIFKDIQRNKTKTPTYTKNDKGEFVEVKRKGGMLNKRYLK